MQISNKSQLSADETKENIISAAETLFRRHGPAKTKIVDVARHLGMSHANVYRHFTNKAEIEDVVAERWLESIIQPLDAIVKGRGLASNRLRKWINTLIEIKLTSFQEDPELFETYHNLAEASREVIQEHVKHLRTQIAYIIKDGVNSGEFNIKNVNVAARAFHEAMTRFQHPFFITRPDIHSDEHKPVVELILEGFKHGVV